MKNKKVFLNEIDKYAKALGKASVWKNSKEIVNSIKSGENHFVYEFFCYLSIINDLETNYSIKYVPGNGKNKHRFPKRPVPKKGRPYFIIVNKIKSKKSYQVCHGTQIKVKAGNELHAPDISFQDENANKKVPTAEQVYIIMDAKYTDTPEKSINSSSFDSVVKMVKALDVEDAENEKILFKKYDKFKGNCIITNGKAYKEEKEYHGIFKITEVEKFDENQNFKIKSF